MGCASAFRKLVGDRLHHAPAQHLSPFVAEGYVVTLSPVVADLVAMSAEAVDVIVEVVNRSVARQQKRDALVEGGHLIVVAIIGARCSARPHDHMSAQLDPIIQDTHHVSVRAMLGTFDAMQAEVKVDDVKGATNVAPPVVRDFRIAAVNGIGQRMGHEAAVAKMLRRHTDLGKDLLRRRRIPQGVT